MRYPGCLVLWLFQRLFVNYLLSIFLDLFFKFLVIFKHDFLYFSSRYNNILKSRQKHFSFFWDPSEQFIHTVINPQVKWIIIFWTANFLYLYFSLILWLTAHFHVSKWDLLREFWVCVFQIMLYLYNCSSVVYNEISFRIKFLLK